MLIEREVAKPLKKELESGKIVLLGSSRLNLLLQTTESLTGRNRKIELPHGLLRNSLRILQQLTNAAISRQHF